MISKTKRIKWKSYHKNIPSRVEVSPGIFYEIVWIEGFKDTAVLGETRFHEKQIVLKKGEASKLTVETYFHEWFHAFSFEIGADLTENQVLALENTFPLLVKQGNLFKE